MEDHADSSSSRLKRVRKKKKGTQPKSLSLAQEVHADSKPVKHKSCSQLPEDNKQLELLAKPFKHSSCTHAPNRPKISAKDEGKKIHPSPRYTSSPRGSSNIQSFPQSPRSSFGGFGSPRSSRPPMMIGAGAKPLPLPILSSVMSFESAPSSYDMESEVHFMRRFSSRRSDINRQKPVADTVTDEADRTVQSDNRRPQRKAPHGN